MITAVLWFLAGWVAATWWRWTSVFAQGVTIYISGEPGTLYLTKEL